MDQKIIPACLREADQHIAEQRTEIERFKVEMAGLEANARSTSELRHAVEQLEAVLALYIQHREELAESLPGENSQSQKKPLGIKLGRLFHLGC